jgi:sodium/proline symporter
MMCALFWKRTNLWGALAGMVSGGATVLLWQYVIEPFGVKNGIAALSIYELLPAFIVGLAAIIIVSILTPAPSKEVVEEYEAVGK